MKPPNRRVSLPENPVNFLKVILSDDTRSTGIRMPKNFTEKHGKNLMERVILKVPNGDVWHVGLQKSRDEIWLENGWWEFAEHYGLKYGHLLMFKYEGFSIFGVIIFDITASEIVYPPMKKDQIRNFTKEVPRKSQQQPKFTEVKPVKIEDETSSSGEDNGECSWKSLKDKRREVKRAEATFKSDKPFFVAHIQKSYFKRKRGVVTSYSIDQKDKILNEFSNVFSWMQRVPKEFWRKYCAVHNKHNKYLLKLANDERQKTWEVLEVDSYLGHGDWMMFVKENDITVGDICAFELIHEHQNVLDVTILSSST